MLSPALAFAVRDHAAGISVYGVVRESVPNQQNLPAHFLRTFLSGKTINCWCMLREAPYQLWDAVHVSVGGSPASLTRQVLERRIYELPRKRTRTGDPAGLARQ
jgi:hypothetical protein